MAEIIFEGIKEKSFGIQVQMMHDRAEPYPKSTQDTHAFPKFFSMLTSRPPIGESDIFPSGREFINE